MIKETFVHLDNHIIRMAHGQTVFCDIKFCVYFNIDEGDNTTPPTVYVKEIQYINGEAYNEEGKRVHGLCGLGLEQLVREDGILEDYVDSNLWDLVHESVEV